MTTRFRLNLDAPFLQAASYNQRRSSAKPFRRAAANDVPSGRSDTDSYLRRPSPRNRAKGVDYTGETMARYISGLETRLTRHIQKHLPLWHERETQKVLRRWSAPHLKPLAPSWAPPRNMKRDAQDYAAALLRERLRARMQKLADIRIARTLDDDGVAAPRRMRRMKM